MPKSELDYSNTIIYKITCKNKDITDVYVGHTTNFVQRKHAHKQGCINNKSANHNCKLYEVIRANGGWANWHMEIINFFNCADHYAARKKEQEYFIELKATLNSIEPFPKSKVKINTIDNETAIKEIIIHEKIDSKYSCQKCHYNTCNKKDFRKHEDTIKHKQLSNLSESYLKNPIKEYQCKCGKKYKHGSTLSTHKKTCKMDSSMHQLTTMPSDVLFLTNLVLDVVKNNTELHKQTNEISKQNNELIKQNQEFQKQMLELYKNTNTEI
jgi:hypothetical protein